MEGKITAAEFIVEVENSVTEKLINSLQRKVLLQDMANILTKLNTTSTPYQDFIHIGYDKYLDLTVETPPL